MIRNPNDIQDGAKKIRMLIAGYPGIGKSTQADLWQRYEGAELLNGDRTVLRRIDGVWTAFGSPYAGSSNCFVNESRPVRAIVLLSQGSVCSLRRPRGRGGAGGRLHPRSRAGWEARRRRSAER